MADNGDSGTIPAPIPADPGGTRGYPANRLPATGSRPPAPAPAARPGPATGPASPATGEAASGTECPRCSSTDTRVVPSQGGHTVKCCDACSKVFLTDVAEPAYSDVDAFRAAPLGFSRDNNGRMWFKLF